MWIVFWLFYKKIKITKNKFLHKIKSFWENSRIETRIQLSFLAFVSLSTLFSISKQKRNLSWLQKRKKRTPILLVGLPNLLDTRWQEEKIRKSWIYFSWLGRNFDWGDKIPEKCRIFLIAQGSKSHQST